MANPKAVIKVICPTCDEVLKRMKLGDKDQGGEVRCRACSEDLDMPKVLVLPPNKSVPPPEPPVEGE